MLRVTVAETATEQRWTLEGRLVGPWVGELRTDAHARSILVRSRSSTKVGKDSCESWQGRPRNSSPRVFTSSVYSINRNPAGSADCAKLFTASSVLSWEESSLPSPSCKRAGNRPFLLLASRTHPLSLGRGRIPYAGRSAKRVE